MRPPSCRRRSSRWVEAALESKTGGLEFDDIKMVGGVLQCTSLQCTSRSFALLPPLQCLSAAHSAAPVFAHPLQDIEAGAKRSASTQALNELARR